jgi:hypothetical protein
LYLLFKYLDSLPINNSVAIGVVCAFTIATWCLAHDSKSERKLEGKSTPQRSTYPF